MRSILTIAQYDLLKVLKARETFLFGLLMPGVMMLLLGLTMGGMDDTPAITLDVINEDDSALAAQFVEVLKAELVDETDSFRLCVYPDAVNACKLDVGDPAEWRATATQRLEDTDAYGTLIIPAGFGAQVLAGETVTVIYQNSAELSAPTLAEQKIDAAISRMSGSIALASLAVTVADESFGGFADDAARQSAFEVARSTAEAAWDQPPIRVTSEASVEQITQVGFNQSGPGIAVMFTFIFALNAAAVLVGERETGTLQRLYTLPVSRMAIIAGKLIGHYVYVLLIFTVLVVMGVLMGVEWGDNVIGIILIMLIFTLTGTALGLLLATVVRTGEQAGNIAILFAMILAPLGGAWWPMEIVPDVMRTIGHISPLAWAMDAFGELMYYNGGVADILPMLGVLLGMAALFFGLGVLNFRYE